jgi:hypothetical protein
VLSRRRHAIAHSSGPVRAAKSAARWLRRWAARTAASPRTTRSQTESRAALATAQFHARFHRSADRDRWHDRGGSDLSWARLMVQYRSDVARAAGRRDPRHSRHNQDGRRCRHRRSARCFDGRPYRWRSHPRGRHGNAFPRQDQRFYRTPARLSNDGRGAENNSGPPFPSYASWATSSANGSV